MGFRFPLATVLRFRQGLEKREELALKKVLLEIAQTRRRIEQLSADIARAEDERENALRRSITAFQLQSMLSEASAAIDRRRVLLESLVPLEQRRVQQMKAYQAAHRDRQMLSDMASRQRDAYEQDRTRAQQKMLDDVFASRAQRG